MASRADKNPRGKSVVAVPALVAAAAMAAAGAAASPPQADDRPVFSVVTAYTLEAATAAPVGPAGTAITRFIHFADGSCAEGIGIEVRELAPTARYEVIVDGTPAAVLTTDEHGGAAISLEGPDRAGEAALPAPLSPITRVGAIAVRDARGCEVLRGDVANAQRRVRTLGDGATLTRLKGAREAARAEPRSALA